MPPLENISIFLEFWSELFIAMRDNFVERKLLKELLIEKYTWWKPFFDRFLQDYLDARAAFLKIQDTTGEPNDPQKQVLQSTRATGRTHYQA
jgi:hypothetical protein